MATVIFGLRHKEVEINFSVKEGWCEKWKCLKRELEFRPLTNLDCGKGLSSSILCSAMERKAKMYL